MPLPLAPPQERRHSARRELPAHVAISVLSPERTVVADGVNVSEGGLCLRLQQTFEVRSLIRLQLAPSGAAAVRSSRLCECTGRVAWVIQRLDLRDTPPFLFDVGIEFVDPPPLIRQLLARGGSRLATLKRRVLQKKPLEPALLRGRSYAPRVERVSNHALRWHLVVTVDGVPCFSGHYAAERQALAAWAQFKRRQASARR